MQIADIDFQDECSSFLVAARCGLPVTTLHSYADDYISYTVLGSYCISDRLTGRLIGTDGEHPFDLVIKQVYC